MDKETQDLLDIEVSEDTSSEEDFEGF